MATDVPNRWMRLRQPRGFSDLEFDVFRASCEIVAAYADSLLANWRRLPLRGNDAPVSYVFFPPELSADRTVASLPIGGAQTLGTRAAIENFCSFMLWQHLPMRSMDGLEEGLTETIDPEQGPSTHWRLPMKEIGFLNADPEWRKRMQA